MPKQIVIKPSLCTGCSTCSLACSMHNRGEFRPSLAFIKISRMDFDGMYEIAFSSGCIGCCSCAKSCPSGALTVVEL